MLVVEHCLFHGWSPIRHFYQPNFPRDVAMFWQVKVAPELECSICCEMLSTKEVNFFVGEKLHRCFVGAVSA